MGVADRTLVSRVSVAAGVRLAPNRVSQCREHSATTASIRPKQFPSQVKSQSTRNSLGLVNAQ